MLKKFGFTWKEIQIPNIQNHLGEKDIMCLKDEEFFFIEKTDVPPDYIRFDYFIHGKWYVRIE